MNKQEKPIQKNSRQSKSIIKQFLIVLMLIVAGCQPSTETIGDVINVGLELNYPPFNFALTTQEEGSLPVTGTTSGLYVAGYDVEIAKAVAEQLNKPIVIKTMPFSTLINALQAKEIDLIIDGISPTEKRKEVISFSESYYTSKHVVLIKKTNKYANATTLEDLRGAEGIGKLGTVYANIVDALAKDHGVIKRPEMDEVNEITHSLIEGVGDFTILEYPVAQGFLYTPEGQDFKILFQNEDNIFNVAAVDRDVAIGVRKKAKPLLEEVNKALAKISEQTRNEMMDAALERARSVQ
jgi:putative lysine transport system permease protein